MIYPLAVAAISAVFLAAVLRQYRQRGKPYQLIWTVALAMSTAASLAYVFALPPTASAVAFRVYYVFGAELMPAWLGLGSIFLVTPRQIADWALATLLAASALAAGAVAQATVNSSLLAQLNGGPGSGVLEPGPWLPLTIVLNTCGVIAVVGVAMYSGVQLARRKGSGRMLGANALIAAGDLIVGVAGSMARTGQPELFWVTMFAGWIVIFSGFLLTSYQPSASGIQLAARTPAES